jgi:hypothetical protein
MRNCCGHNRVWWVILSALLLIAGGCKKGPSGQATGNRKAKAARSGVPDEARQVPVEAVPAGPLAKYRTGKIEDRVLEVPPRLTQLVKQNPAQVLPELVDFLTAEVEDPFLKTKLIHDWVADNIRYDIEGYFSPGVRKGTGSDDVLRNGSSVCAGYASVFDRMSKLAGIHSVTVSGYARGFGFDPWQKEDTSDSNHAWNAVEIEGEYYLVDTTWDSGGVRGSSWGKNYSTHLLFPTPDAFVHTHFPSKQGWQLLDPPITAEQFAELPYLRGEFFSAGLELRSPVDVLNSAKDRASVELTVPQSTLLIAHVASPDRQKFKRTGLVQRTGDIATVHALFPEAGKYRLNLFSRPVDSDGKYNLVAAFAYEAAAGTSSRFPQTYKVYSEIGATVFQPLMAPLTMGTSVRFSVRAPGVEAVAVVQAGSHWTHLSKQEDETFSGNVPITSSQPAKVFARLTPEDRRWQGLLEY